jgi:hypothetical protein
MRQTNKASAPGQIYLFPVGVSAASPVSKEVKTEGPPAARGTSVVLCGTYRKACVKRLKI